VVVADKTPFYRYGPAQTFGPDLQLLRGNTALLLRHGFGFSQILTEAGVAGYVPTEDLGGEPDPAALSGAVSSVHPEWLTEEPPQRNTLTPRWDLRPGALPKP
jgi:hypothetical protein